MGMREHDPLEVRDWVAETPDLLEDEPAVRLVERVDQGEVGAVPDQEGVHPAACVSANRPDARCELHVLESFRLTRSTKGGFIAERRVATRMGLFTALASGLDRKYG